MTTQPGKLEAKKSRNLYKVGLLVTVGYFALLILTIAALSHLGWFEWKKISLNEVGDFLAGAFSPVAFFWLILGFLQQGHELQLQVAEMANSVSQQKEMVDVSRAVLEHERTQAEHRQLTEMKRLQPNLHIRIASKSGLSLDAGKLGPENRPYKYSLTTKNAGARVLDVEFELLPVPQTMHNTQYSLIESGAEIQLEFTCIGRDAPLPSDLIVRCKNDIGHLYLLTYHVVRRGHFDLKAMELLSYDPQDLDRTADRGNQNAQNSPM
ncbi:hypothetical protein [Salipiger sp. PrR007]|uniref:hypothetical protein n=1 Tax=Salipiger sp. PrR007 TaxID=2706884 RepID=UPI0013B6E16F|nr:hypothetical protein [Salipiger sp. PrR007]NDW30998.1 hypothetical protein [Salipiger sp. PrR007]